MASKPQDSAQAVWADEQDIYFDTYGHQGSYRSSRNQNRWGINPYLSSRPPRINMSEIDLGNPSSSRSARSPEMDTSSGSHGPYKYSTTPHQDMEQQIAYSSRMAENHQLDMESGYSSSSRSARRPELNIHSSSDGSYGFPTARRSQIASVSYYSFPSPQDLASDMPPGSNGLCGLPSASRSGMEPNSGNSSLSIRNPHPHMCPETHGSFSSPSTSRSGMNLNSGYSSQPRRARQRGVEPGSSSSFRSLTDSRPDVYTSPQSLSLSLSSHQQNTENGSFGSIRSHADRYLDVYSNAYDVPFTRDHRSGMGANSFSSQFLSSRFEEMDLSAGNSYDSLRSPHTYQPINANGVGRFHHRRQPAMLGGEYEFTDGNAEVYEMHEKLSPATEKPLSARLDSPWPSFIAPPSSTLTAPVPPETLATPRPRLPTNPSSGITMNEVYPGMAMAMEVGGSVLKEFAQLGKIAESVTAAAVLYSEPRTAMRAIKSFFKHEPALIENVKKLEDFIVVVTCHSVEKSFFNGVEIKAIQAGCWTMFPQFEAMSVRLSIVSRIMSEKKGEKRTKEMNELLKHIGELHHLLERMISAIEAHIENKLQEWVWILEEFREIRLSLKKELGMVIPGQIVPDEATKKVAQELSGVGIYTPKTAMAPDLPPNAEKYLEFGEAYARADMPNQTLIPHSPTHTALGAGSHQPFGESPEIFFQDPSLVASQSPFWTHSQGSSQMPHETDIADEQVTHGHDTPHLAWQQIQHGTAQSMNPRRS